MTTDNLKDALTLDLFLARYKANDNEWWYLSSGEMMNLFDEAVDRWEAAQARLTDLSAENERLKKAGESVADMLGIEIQRGDDNWEAALHYKTELGALQSRINRIEEAARPVVTELKRQQRDGTLSVDDESFWLDIGLVMSLAAALDTPSTPEETQ